MNVKPIPPAMRAEGTASTGTDSSRTQAMAKAERQFHAMLLREMLKPLTQALFGKDTGLSSSSPPLLGSSGSETYAYFLEQALSQQLSQAWPLPDPFGDVTSTPDSRGGPIPGATLPASRGGPIPGATLPASVPLGRRPGLIPSAGALAPHRLERTPLPISLDGARDSSRIAAPLPARKSQSVSQAIPKGTNLPEAEIRRASRLFDLPENLVRAVVLTESGGRADAVSPKGAVGYMQVLPSTGKEMGASNVRDPWQNVYAGTKYLRRQLDRFGNLEHALAAYNAGPGAVERHGGIPPYRETQVYVERVLSRKEQLDRIGS